MYEFDQELANRIAETVKLKYQLTTELFQSTEEQAEDIEEQIRKYVLERTDSSDVAKGVIVFLPLLLEHEAISEFQDKTQINIRNIAPEILTPKEGALWAQQECMLMDEECKLVEEFLADILAEQKQLLGQYKKYQVNTGSKIEVYPDGSSLEIRNGTIILTEAVAKFHKAEAPKPKPNNESKN